MTFTPNNPNGYVTKEYSLPVRILRTDAKGSNPIVAAITLQNGQEVFLTFNEKGKYVDSMDSWFDLADKPVAGEKQIPDRIWIDKLAIPSSPKLAGTYYLHDDENHETIEYGPIAEKNALQEEVEAYKEKWAAQKIIYEDAEKHVTDLESENANLREALNELLQAVCGETGFATCVRLDSGFAYPWPSLDIAERKARAALNETQETKQ